MTTPWRAFKFFEVEAVKAQSNLLERLEITTATCGRNHLYFGDAEGYVRIIERSTGTLQKRIQAYTSMVTHMKLLRSSRNVLVTVGDDDNATEVGIVRIWDFDRRAGKGSDVHCRDVRLFTARHPPPDNRLPLRINYNPDVTLKFKGNPTDDVGGKDAEAEGAEDEACIVSSGSLVSCVVCFDVSDDFSQIAVALSNNTIILVRGEFDRDRTTPKVRALTTKHSKENITFVGFPKTKEGPGGSAGSPGAFHSLLYACYEDATVVFPLPMRFTDAVDERCFQPKVGASFDCAAINDEGELYVASNKRSEISIFGGEDFLSEKRQAWAEPFTAIGFASGVEGEKKKLAFHKHYFILLTRPEPDKKPEKFSLGIFDKEARIRAVAVSQGAQSNVSWVLPDVADVYVIAQEPKNEGVLQRVTKYMEVDTQTKLDQLFKKDMYDEAKRIARRLTSGSGTGATAADDEALGYEIQRKYGDHLYEKGKFDLAVEQYIEAIKGTEPSYVIRKFLGEQRIGNLTTYLEALHKKENGQLANKNHTTLLLNCYAKLKREDQLKQFIRREDIVFDATNAIHVCRQAGYFDAATFLAKKYNQPTEYVKILLENLDQHEEALRFVQGLQLVDAEKIMKQHGKVFLAVLPEEATRTMIRLCTDWKFTPPAGKPGTAAAAAPPAKGGPQRARAAEFIPIFVDTPLWLYKLLVAVVRDTYRRTPNAPISQGGVVIIPDEPEVLNTLLELCLADELPSHIRHTDDTAAGDADGAASPMHPAALMEAHAKKSKELQVAADQRRSLALELLHDYQGQFDPYHALMLVQQHNFEAGVLHMLKTLGLHNEVFVYHAKQFERGESKEVRQRAKNALREACLESEAAAAAAGNTGPATETVRDMWISFLALLVRSRDEEDEDITRVLETIERGDLLPPVAVIEILASNDTLKLRAVRQYVTNMIKRDQLFIDAAQKEITELQEKTARTKDEVLELQTTAQVFQSNKCQECEQPLDLPAIHFLCKHSYHQRCLTDVRECNVCAPQQKKHIALQREFDELAGSHDQFFTHLRSKPDGLSVIAEQFGRGIFTTRRGKGGDEADGLADEDPDDDDLLGADADGAAMEALETW